MATTVNDALLPQNNTENKTIVHMTSVEANQSDTKGRRCMQLKHICPPQGSFALVISNVLFLLLIFGFCWGVAGKMCVPGGKLFALIVVFSASYLFGALATKIHLPDLFGMIISGIVLRNVPFIVLEESLDQELSSILRSTALAIILVRAGMGLDPGALKRLSCAVFRLAFSPCLVEICCTGVVSHFLLGLPWTYGFILGSVLAAVSPAVVVPCLLNLSAQGYGIDKGIPTLVIAASSVDDILAISVFGVFIGITFAEGNIVFIVLKSPIEIAMGTAFGLVFGILLWFIPHAQNKRKMLIRFVLLLLCALVGLFASARAGFGGAGPFAALLLGFVVQMRWRKETDITEDEKESVSKNFEIIWTIFKPFLFGLIGAEVSFSKLELNVIGIGVATLFIGLAFRMATTFLVVCGNKFSIGEKIFITIAWLPKATVQAAIGGVALDMVRKRSGSDEELEYGLKIVSLAVLSILITAPLGAILISNLGPKLLTKASQNALAMTKSGDRSKEDLNSHDV